jgi:RNA recognition motif-containing protein
VPLALTGQDIRFAFVDFTSIEHAMAVLVHPKNHQLDGRKLVVEYASADAVRRGGGAGPRPKKASAEGTGKDLPHRKKRGSVVGDRANEQSHTTTITTTKNSKQQEAEGIAPGRRNGAFAKAKVNSGARKPRPTPGAALALAKREQVAIVPSQGRRITFDD